jgi:chitinase
VALLVAVAGVAAVWMVRRGNETSAPTEAVDPRVAGYFVQRGSRVPRYEVRNIETSGAAPQLTDLLYAFGSVATGRCTSGDDAADHERVFSAADSIDGVADTADQPLRGNFNQLRKLKQRHPDLKLLWSFGGWNGSAGFTEAAKDPAGFAESCRALLDDPRWTGLFDGLDIDWEYPNACGLTCDSSGRAAFGRLTAALRAALGPDRLLTAAITADGNDGGRIDTTDYAAAAGNLDWLMPMAYDYTGADKPQGPTAPHSPLTGYPGMTQTGGYADAALRKLEARGIPARKLLLGVGFYGRGWTGVTQSEPGGTATALAPGSYEPGVESYDTLQRTCPPTGTVGGTAYARCGDQWWSYDTPGTIAVKMGYARDHRLGGAFFWELSGDTERGELVTAVAGGLR